MEKVLHYEIKNDEELVEKLKPLLEKNRGKLVYMRQNHGDFLADGSYELGIIAETGNVILQDSNNFTINVSGFHAFKNPNKMIPGISKSGKFPYLESEEPKPCNVHVIWRNTDYFIGTAEELVILPYFPELHSALEAELIES